MEQRFTRPRFSLGYRLWLLVDGPRQQMLRPEIAARKNLAGGLPRGKFARRSVSRRAARAGSLVARREARCHLFLRQRPRPKTSLQHNVHWRPDALPARPL